MGRGSATLTGSKGSRELGVVSGFTLKLARQSAALTQERLAESLGVDVSTIQGWESGRRPLAATNAGDLLRLAGRLRRLGAPPSTGRHLHEAIEADQVLSTAIVAETSWVDPENHPLASIVCRRTIMNLITWPFVGRQPEQLAEFTPKVPKRGPVPMSPTLCAEERTRFFDHLMTVAERANRPSEALLRRQAVYLLGFDGRSRAADWLHVEWDRAGRHRINDGDIAGLLEARSASVALASAGDGSRLHDFVDQMAGSGGNVANLNYWAHWIGELHEEQTSDAFMLNPNSGSWTGHRLLRHLANRIEPDSPHLPLNLSTVHALVASRPALLNGRKSIRTALAEILARVASFDCLSGPGRDQLAGLQYALRFADR